MREDERSNDGRSSTMSDEQPWVRVEYDKPRKTNILELVAGTLLTYPQSVQDRWVRSMRRSRTARRTPPVRLRRGQRAQGPEP